MVLFLEFLHVGQEQLLRLANQCGEIETFHCTYKTLLSFVTGALRPPPSGFEPLPTIAFDERLSLYP